MRRDSFPFEETDSKMNLNTTIVSASIALTKHKEDKYHCYRPQLRPIVLRQNTQVFHNLAVNISEHSVLFRCKLSSDRFVSGTK